MDRSTSCLQALPQGEPQVQEMSIPAPIGQRIIYSASFPSHHISRASLETQDEDVEAPRGSMSPHPTWGTPKSIGPFATSSYSRHSILKQESKKHVVRYRCEICPKEYTQRQGVRRHQREKHEPNYCPHCPTFRWGRLYQFKDHLKKKHPEVDFETDMIARRCYRSDAIPTIDPTYSHFPFPRSAQGGRCLSTPRVTVRSSPIGPRLSPSLQSLDPFLETLDTTHEGASIGAQEAVSASVGASSLACMTAEMKGWLELW